MTLLFLWLSLVRENRTLRCVISRSDGVFYSDKCQHSYSCCPLVCKWLLFAFNFIQSISVYLYLESRENFLALKIPRTEETGGLQSVESQTVRHDWAQLHTHTQTINRWIQSGCESAKLTNKMHMYNSATPRDLSSILYTDTAVQEVIHIWIMSHAECLTHSTQAKNASQMSTHW